jgi:hypothetical protein
MYKTGTPYHQFIHRCGLLVGFGAAARPYKIFCLFLDLIKFVQQFDILHSDTILKGV